MARNNTVEFIIRLLIFVCTAVFYFLGVDIAGDFTAPFTEGVSVAHGIWMVMMIGLVLQFFPNPRFGLGNNKQFEKSYRQPEHGFDGDALQEELQRMNRGARNVLMVWLAIMLVLAGLYFNGILRPGELLLVIAGLYLCDGFCMLFWCPLQKFLMEGGSCCADCRIYGWGNFLVFGMLLFIPSFFTYSLVLTAFALLVRWETTFLRRPERFWKGSNASLQCKHCTDKSCEFKCRFAAEKVARIFKLPTRSRKQPR